MLNPFSKEFLFDFEECKIQHFVKSFAIWLKHDSFVGLDDWLTDLYETKPFLSKQWIGQDYVVHW